MRLLFEVYFWVWLRWKVWRISRRTGKRVKIVEVSVTWE